VKTQGYELQLIGALRFVAATNRMYPKEDECLPEQAISEWQIILGTQ
jgi:hypothetical protein